MERGIKIRIIGNISLLPEDLIKLIAEAELATKDNSNAILNVAFSYTGFLFIYLYLGVGLLKDVLDTWSKIFSFEV